MRAFNESSLRSHLEEARRLVSSQLTEKQYQAYVTEDRLADVARWLEKGWEVKVYFQDAQWREDGVGDDITYAGVVIKPILK